MWNRKTIGIDLDDVIYPFIEQFKPFCEDILGRELKQPEQYSLTQEWGISEEKFLELHDYYTSCLRFEIGTFRDKEAMIKIAEKYDIHLITARCVSKDYLTMRRCYESTVSWIYKNRVPHKALHFVQDKSIVNVDILVDDCAYNLEKTKAIPICYERSWNKDWYGYSIKNLSEIEEYL